MSEYRLIEDIGLITFITKHMTKRAIRQFKIKRSILPWNKEVYVSNETYSDLIDAYLATLAIYNGSIPPYGRVDLISGSGA